MSHPRVVIVGGGAAGFFAAITCAEACPQAEVTVLEKSSQFLAKVKISGGGRCNVTNACTEPRDLSRGYPRGGDALLGPFHAFSTRDTIAWFESRGVQLKTESDGRVFPVTDSSATVIHCLTSAAQRAGVRLLPNHPALYARRDSGHKFAVRLGNGEDLTSDCLMLATGGCRAAANGGLAVSLGHALEAPVPSLFTFHIQVPWLRALAGISLPQAEISLPGLGLRERGPLLVTHEGLSGPAILRLSAWGARLLHAAGYNFPLRVNWVPAQSATEIAASVDSCRAKQAARRVVNGVAVPLPARLWEALVIAAGIPATMRWAELPRSSRHQLIEQLTNCEFQASGRSLNQDEFVTCGGVRLKDVNFKTMESRIVPGLYFGGELLDIDGVTGGFNFQAAWTTGWLAGKAMAAAAG